MSHEHSTGPNSWMASDQVAVATADIVRHAVVGKSHIIESIAMYIYNNTVEVGWGTDAGVIEHILWKIKVPANQGGQLSTRLIHPVKVPPNKAIIIKATGASDYSYVIEGITE